MAAPAPATPPPADLAVTARPRATDVEAVLALVERAAATDGHRAVNEAGLLALRGAADASSTDAPERSAVHVLARAADGGLVGYAQAIWEGEVPVAALVVDPAHRRRGTGAALWRALAERTAAPLRVWAGGDSPAARALAGAVGLQPVRTLLVLGRPLSGDLPPVEPRAGITLRTFVASRPGRPGDEDGWVRANAHAFASHPEQGALTRADLEQRMAEPWFDPAGLFLAVRDADAAIVGFHWTKREPGADTGEVYVIGVDPTAGVRRLGTPLLGAGLAHLRDLGCRAVDLYVEADNERALALYRRYGFSPVSADVMYAAPSVTDAPPT